MTAEALTTEQLEEILEEWRNEILKDVATFNRGATHPKVLAKSILALIEGAQGKDGGVWRSPETLPRNLNVGFIYKHKKDYVSSCVFEEPEGEGEQYWDDAVSEAVAETDIIGWIPVPRDADDPAPPQVVPQAGGERTPGTVEVCADCLSDLNWIADFGCKHELGDKCPIRSAGRG